MSKKVDFSDLRILEALAKYGPRNVTEVARKLDIAAETLRKRIKRLRSQFFLWFGINIYHTFLGLKKAIVFAEAIPGYEDLLLGFLKKNDFWIALARSYGMFEGCVGVFTIPKDHCAEFEQFLREVQKLGVVRNVQLFWSTCFQSVYSRCNWFDQKSDSWKFQWDNWIKEIGSEKTELPYTLVDPTSFPIKGDEIDVFILKELEKDATISFDELGKKLGISPQLVRYHYQKHLMERGLIENFEVTFFHFDRQMSDFSFFIFRFDSIEKLAKFASSLLDKPFVKALGKILGENTLYGYIYLPKSEFRKFLKVLSELIRGRVLESYHYAIQDLESSFRQTISYEYFRDGAWIYDHKKHIENLHNLVKETAFATGTTREITL